ELRGLVGAGPPGVPIRRKRHSLGPFVLVVERTLARGVRILRRIAPDLAAFNSRTAIGDRDIGNTDALHDACLLARPGERKLSENGSSKNCRKSQNKNGNSNFEHSGLLRVRTTCVSGWRCLIKYSS